MPISNCTVSGGSLNCSRLTDASCDHSMDLGVVCSTYKQLYNELLAQQSSTSPPVTCECPMTTCSTSSGDPNTQSCDCSTERPINIVLNAPQQDPNGNSNTITALGVVTAFLVFLLVGTVTVLVITCRDLGKR